MKQDAGAKAEIWAVAERQQEEWSSATLGLLAEGKRLCRKLNGASLSAVVLGCGGGGLGGDLGPYGAERVYFCDLPFWQGSDPERASTLIAELALEKAPLLILFAATAVGSDLAPRVAARLRSPVVTQCVDLKVGQGRRLEFVKPVFDEMLYASIQCEKAGIQLATVSPSVLEAEEPEGSHKAELVRITPAPSDRAGRLRTLDVIRGDPKTLAIEDADIVVAGGRGLGDAQSFELVHALAEALQGSVAGTRPVVDQGLVPFERQIGRTGKSVSPKLFVACGISGASEFTGGMDRSKQVIAINTDPNAPIFQRADLGLVGDCREIIPQILRLLRERSR